MHSSFSPLQKPRQNLQNHCQISWVNRTLYPIWFACRLKSYPIWCRNITRWKNGFAQICSRQICSKIEKTEEWIKGKDGKCYICLLIYNPAVFFGMQMWHLPSLPQIYIPVFTFVQHICKEQFEIHFFRPKPCWLDALRALIKASLSIIASYLVEYTRLKWIFSPQKVFSWRSGHVCITFQNICVL